MLNKLWGILFRELQKARSFWTRWQILFEETITQRFEMAATYAVAAVWIFHKTELLVQIDQFVEQALGALEMNVVIAAAMDDEEFPLQTTGVRDGRTIFVALRI